jgi:hypothetical protein
VIIYEETNMNTLFRTAIIPIALIAASPVAAATTTLDFAGANSTFNASGGAFFFSDTHFVTETFTGTGIADATTLTFDLQLNTNRLRDNAFVTFEARTNMDVLGSFTINDGDGTGPFSFSFNYTDPDPIGDNYSIGLFATNNVPGGDGSVSFLLGSSSVTISDGAVSAVPLPAGGMLLLSGLAGIAGLQRRKKHAA